MKKIIYIIFLMASVGMAACTNNDNKDPGPGTGPEPDLYISGGTYDTPARHFYLKNHSVHFVGDADFPGEGRAIYVDGSDVYFAFEDGYLKNGVKVSLPGASYVSDICVQDGSV